MEALPEGIPEPLLQRARAAAAWIEDQIGAGRRITVVHHIDADGVSAGAVARRALERAGATHGTLAAKSLDDVHVAAIQEGGHEALWFCDFGSTAYMHFPDTPRLVCDHHELVRDGSEDSFPHVNPLMDDLPGDTISGAGCTYLVAAHLDVRNRDLLPMALVGAAGDLQDRRGGFSGTNRRLLELGRRLGLVEVEQDVTWYGRETRTLTRYLTGAREPSVPGLRDRASVRSLLAAADVAEEEGPKERTWAALSPEERLRLRSLLVGRLLDAGTPAEQVAGILGDVVRLCNEADGTPLREVREFATLLNSTARYGRPEIGLAVACGDRGDALAEAFLLLDGHRQHLSQAIKAVAQSGVEERSALQWVHLQDRVHDTVVGTVCGMALEALSLRRDMPIVGFAHTPDGRTKASARAPDAIQGRIDLATGMREAAASVGGQGGGHRGAAGATIPRGTEARFLDALETVVAPQLGIVQLGEPLRRTVPAAAPVPASAPAHGSPAAPAPAPAAQGPARPLRGQATLF